MGKHFALTLQLPNYQREAKTQKTQSKFLSENIGMYLFAGCIVLVLAYLVQVNSLSTKGYQIQKLQNKVSALREDNKKLTINSTELQSMDQVKSDPAITAMVPVTSINYVHSATLTER